MNQEEVLIKLAVPPKRVGFQLKTMEVKHALVVSPHSDDETLGCGGTLLHMSKLGVQADIALLTCDHTRQMEFNRAFEILSCRNKYLFSFQDNGLWPKAVIYMLKRKLKKLLLENHYDLIFIPYLFDYHRDHLAAAMALSDALDPAMPVTVCMYEIWTPILYPDLYINVSGHYEEKKQAIRCYQSQLQRYDLINRDSSLRRFRGALTGKQEYRYVEAFKRFSSDDFKAVVKASCHEKKSYDDKVK